MVLVTMVNALKWCHANQFNSGAVYAPSFTLPMLQGITAIFKEALVRRSMSDPPTAVSNVVSPSL